MYKILPDPNVGKKVRILIEDTNPIRARVYSAGTIGIIENINHANGSIYVALPPDYRIIRWFGAGDLEEIEG